MFKFTSPTQSFLFKLEHKENMKNMLRSFHEHILTKNRLREIYFLHKHVYFPFEKNRFESDEYLKYSFYPHVLPRF